MKSDRGIGIFDEIPQEILAGMAINISMMPVITVELPVDIRGDIHNFFRKLSDLIPKGEGHDKIVDVLMSIKKKLLSDDEISLMLINNVADTIRDVIDCLRVETPPDYNKLLILFDEYSKRNEPTEIDLARRQIKDVNLILEVNHVIDEWNGISQSIVDIMRANQSGCDDPNRGICN